MDWEQCGNRNEWEKQEILNIHQISGDVRYAWRWSNQALCANICLHQNQVAAQEIVQPIKFNTVEVKHANLLTEVYKIVNKFICNLVHCTQLILITISANFRLWIHFQK